MNKLDVEKKLAGRCNQPVFIIEFKGRPFVADSNKCAWATMGGAKNSFNASMRWAARDLGFKNSSEMRKYCEANGLIKYKRL